MANYRALAAAAARRYGISPDIFLRQIAQESGFNPRARSGAGAIGIAQFMPATARSAGVNPLNPRSALFGAARMDAQNLRKYGNWQDVLSLYNSGRGWSQGRNIGETRNYVRSILGGVQPAAGAAPGMGAVGPPSSPAPASSAPDRSARLALAQNLIAASQATSRGQIPDYAPLYQALSSMHQATRAGYIDRTTAQMATAGAATRAHGVASFDGKPVAAWIAPILKAARRAGWHGTVSSGYRSLAEQTRIYNSGVRPAAKPGTSNHEFTAFPGGAVDVTNAAQLAQILRRLGIHGLQWAGQRDPVHFSHPHGGHY